MDRRQVRNPFWLAVSARSDQEKVRPCEKTTPALLFRRSAPQHRVLARRRYCAAPGLQRPPTRVRRASSPKSRRSPPGGSRRRSRYCPLQKGDIGHDCRNLRALTGSDGTETHFYRKNRSVFAPRKEISARTHQAGLWRSVVLSSVARMESPQSAGRMVSTLCPRSSPRS